MSEIKFIAATKAYKQFILNWFQAEHVKGYYYGDGLQSTLKNFELFISGVNHKIIGLYHSRISLRLF